MEKKKKEKEKVKNHEKFLQKRSGERIAFLTKKKISMWAEKKKRRISKGLDMAINGTTQIKWSQW